MKYIVTILLIILSFSCHKGKTSTDHLLSVADSIMKHHPDSALYLLEQTKPETLSLSNQALYYLLLTEAQDKTYATPTSDSLISIATNYFDQQDDVNQKAKAWYYKGRVNQELNNPLEAQKYYLKALENKEQIKNSDLLGLIHGHIGMLYAYQSVYNSALEYMQKSISYFLQTKDSSQIGFAYRNLGRCYNALNKKDSAIIIYKKALKFITHYTVNAELGEVYADIEDFEHALQFAHMALENKKNGQYQYVTYLILGKTFLNTGIQDSAQFYLEKSSESPSLATQVSALYYLAKLADQKKDLATYAQYIHQFIPLNDSLIHQKRIESTYKTDKLYQFQTIEKKYTASKLALNKARIKYLCILVILLILIISILFILWILKNKQIKQAIQKCDSKEKEIFLLKQQKLEKENLRRKEEIKEREQKILDFQNSMIYMHWINKYNSHTPWKPTNEEWSELRTAFNQAYPLFINNLEQLLPSVSKLEINICFLIKLGFPPSFIAYLLCRNTNAISMSRKRLYSKIFHKEGSAEDFDLFIKGL